MVSFEKSPNLNNPEDSEGKKNDSESIRQDADFFYENNKLFKEVGPKEAKETIEYIESIPEYQEYQQSKVNIEKMRIFIRELEEKTGKTDDDKLKEAVDFTKEVFQDIESGIQRYYSVIQKTQRMKGSVQDFRLSGEEKRLKFSELDKSRKIYHDSIISSLAIFSRFSQKRLPEDFSVDLKIDFFDEEYLKKEENRKEIGSWAYETAFGDRLLKYKKALTEIKQRSN